MINRIVKMHFRADYIETFLSLFDSNKDSIRSFEGCKHLELWRDEDDKGTFFTYSHWQDESALEAYRHSDLFAGIWLETKRGFDQKPLAWSTRTHAIGSAS